MTSLATSRAAIDAAGFEAFLSARQEPIWVTTLRQQAWQAFAGLPFPARTEENWRRTDVRLFHPERYALLAADGDATAVSASAAAATGPAQPGVLGNDVALAGQIVTHNSQAVRQSLDPALEKQGVIFCTLDKAVLDHGDLVRPFFSPQWLPIDDKFSALHAACWSGGTLLYVPRGVHIAQPLHALSVLHGQHRTDTGPLWVILDDGADATLMQETASGDEDGVHVGSVNVLVKRGARLRLVSLQNWGNATWHFAQNRAHLEADASLQWTMGALGGRLARVTQSVDLHGPGGSAQVNGVMFTEGKQHLAYFTSQNHHAPHCTSDLLYKGALQDQSRVVWRGMIKVDKGAQLTNAYQKDDNLLLSGSAKVDSIPGLEIEADNVRCTHGATAGRVDEELVFYLQCRGLTRNEAARMIVTGFFQEVFDRITLESVRDALAKAIHRKIREYS